MYTTKTKVASIHTLYKNGNPAESIEVVKTELNDFDLVCQKGRFKIGDDCLYIIPDVKIPDNGYFDNYVRPNGDVKKSKLSKSGRLRAIKFQFNLDVNSDEIVYSQGLLIGESDLPKSFYSTYSNLSEFPNDFDFDTALQIVKYVSDSNSEKSGNVNGCQTRDFPSFLYKTDEGRIETKKGYFLDESKPIQKMIRIGRKMDGESTTSFVLPNGDFRLCSRNKEKVLVSMEKLTMLRDSNGNEYKPHFEKDVMKRGFKDFENNVFVEIETVNGEKQIPNGFIGIYEKEKDSFVDTVEKMNLASNMIIFMNEKGFPFALRGEIVGSGHHALKHNIDSYDLDTKGNKIYKPSQIVFFGVDEIIMDSNENPISCKRVLNENDFLNEFCTRFNYQYVKPIFEGLMNYDEILKFSKSFFKTEQREGVVIRGKDGFSAKYINPEYDAKS